MRQPRIHIVGASGSGTTTLGAALARELGCVHLAVDWFFWLPSDPPFEQARPPDTRLALLKQALDSASAWTISGSLCGWDDPLIPLFSLVVFLWLPSGVRLARLREREIARYGPAAIEAGGSYHDRYGKFAEWASAYDEGDLRLRSRRLHETWLAKLDCPVMRLEGDMPPEAQTATVMRRLSLP
jgi:adenylate kinase family enzyme